MARQGKIDMIDDNAVIVLCVIANGHKRGLIPRLIPTHEKKEDEKGEGEGGGGIQTHET